MSIDTSGVAGEDLQVAQVITADHDTVLVNLRAFKSESEYFRGIYDSGMREMLEGKIHLPLVSSTAMNRIRDYIEDPDFKPSNDVADLDIIADVISAANYLQITKLLNIYIEHLREHITVNRCRQFAVLGKDLMLPDMYAVADDFMKTNCNQFIESDDYLLLCLEEIMAYLDSDVLNPSTEMDVLHAAWRWTKHNDTDLTAEEITEIFKCTRLGLLTKQQRSECINLCHREKVLNCCIPLAESALCFDTEPVIFHTRHNRWLKMRSGNCINAAIASGGLAKSSERHEHTCSTNKVQYLALTGSSLFSKSESERMSENSYKYRRARRKSMTTDVSFRPIKAWKLLESLCEHGSCVVHDYLYVAGGQKRYRVNGASTQASVWRFDPRTLSWMQVCSMQQPRSLFCLLEVDGFMYAVCGWKAPETVNRTVEKYDPCTDSWSYVAPIQIGLHEHAGCTCKGYIYISGGYKGPQRGHLDKTWRYDPELDEWFSLAALHQARSYHAMVALDTTRLLVAGGVCANADNFYDIQNCELYDISTDQWTVLSAAIPRPACCMPALALPPNIYLFGSHCFQEANDKHDFVQILNTETWTWSEKTMQSGGILFFGLSVVQLPKHIVNSR